MTILKIAAGILVAVGLLWLIGLASGIVLFKAGTEVIAESTKQAQHPAQSLPKPAPKTMDVWVPGKPLDQCLGPDKELNEDVLRCRNGYYKTIVVER